MNESNFEQSVNTVRRSFCICSNHILRCSFWRLNCISFPIHRASNCITLMLSLSSSTVLQLRLSSSFSFIFFCPFIFIHIRYIYSAEFLWGLILCFDRYYTILLIIHSQRARALSSNEPLADGACHRNGKKPDVNSSQTSSSSYIASPTLEILCVLSPLRPFRDSVLFCSRLVHGLSVWVFHIRKYVFTGYSPLPLIGSVAVLFFLCFASTMSHSSAHATRILIAACAPPYTIPMTVNNLPKKKK